MADPTRGRIARDRQRRKRDDRAEALKRTRRKMREGEWSPDAVREAIEEYSRLIRSQLD